MISSREWREPAWELTTATKEAMRLCIGVAEDVQESERVADSVRVIQSELLHLVRLERETEHVMSAVAHAERLASALQAADVPEDPPSLVTEMEGKLTHLLEEDVNFDPSRHPFALELANMVEGGGGEGGGDGAEKEGGGSDEDVQVGEVQVSLKCPLTRRYLEDPVSNTHCGHAYSRAAVMEHIQRRSAARCPVCSGPLSKSSLQPEPGLAEQVRRAQRKRNRTRKEGGSSVVTL